MLVAIIVCHVEIGYGGDGISEGQVNFWAVTEFEIGVELRPAKFLLVETQV